ncbi:hypothetical protein GQ53DRAFT_843772 [Thozetella sp. PMI_491]|nr:hypothetical protein GQ53DRAFT_843772 [Thozetella sp. PMI_491]
MPQSPRSFREMSRLESQLFDFYLNWMCPRCCLLDRYSQSYRQVIIPLGLRSQVVFSAMLSVAAGQLRSQVQNATFYESALHYRGSALRGLSGCLAAAQEFPSSTRKTEALGAILLLCLFELATTKFMTRDSQPDWRTHGLGARGIMESPLPSQHPQCDEAVSSFLGHLLSARIVLTHTTLPAMQDEQGLLEDALYWLPRSTRPRQEVNCFTGCSNELLDIILETAVLLRQTRRDGVTMEADDSKLILEQRLENLDQVLPTKFADQSMNSTTMDVATLPVADDSIPLRIAEAYRWAAIILVQYMGANEHLNENIAIQNAISYILSDESLHCIFPLPNPGKVGRSSFLWPYFIAACHAAADETRMRILEVFSGAVKLSPSCADVLEPMTEVIQGVWKQHDMECLAGVPTNYPQGKWLFPWERVLQYEGWSLNWS